MKKNSLLIVLLLLLALTVISCSPKAEAPAPQTPAEAKEEKVEEKEFTLEELAKYNGENGERAYVAVDGVVYDVTDVPQWPKGAHNGFSAGNDLTEEIKNVSPHGVSKLEGLPVVGKLVK